MVMAVIIIIIIRNLYSAIMPLGGYRGAGVHAFSSLLSPSKGNESYYSADKSSINLELVFIRRFCATAVFTRQCTRQLGRTDQLDPVNVHNVDHNALIESLASPFVRASLRCWSASSSDDACADAREPRFRAFR